MKLKTFRPNACGKTQRKGSTVSIKMVSMCMSLMLLAGCGAAAAPKNSYTDPAPDMVMVKTDAAQVNYKGYRLYLEVLEKFAELTAQENLAFVEMVSKDLTEAGKEYDKAGFDEQVNPMIDQMLENPMIEPIIEQVLTATGMTREQYREAAKMDYLPQDLYDQMMSHLYDTMEDGQDFMTVAGEYQDKFEERTDFANDKVLVKLDGKDIPLTAEHTQYIKYTGAMARAAAIDDIATKQLVAEDMKSKGAVIDEEGFAAYQEETISHLKEDEIYNLLLPKALEKLRITEEAYYKEIEPYFWLSYVEQGFWEFIQQEHAKLPEESKPTIEAYFDQYFAELTAGYEIVNLMGR